MYSLNVKRGKLLWKPYIFTAAPYFQPKSILHEKCSYLAETQPAAMGSPHCFQLQWVCSMTYILAQTSHLDKVHISRLGLQHRSWAFVLPRSRVNENSQIPTHSETKSEMSVVWICVVIRNSFLTWVLEGFHCIFSELVMQWEKYLVKSVTFVCFSFYRKVQSLHSY
jgi:hypothetical protein